MAATSDFIQALQQEFPQFTFKSAQRFSFHPPKTIKYHENEPVSPAYFALLTLHELGHALSKHKDYKTSVERIKIESEAWQRAKTVLLQHLENAPQNLSEAQNWRAIIPDLTWDEDFAEAQLDTYRDWLHTKSTCPTCGLTRYEANGKWHCPLCDAKI